MTDKTASYALLLAQAQALVENETDWIANAANLSALLFHGLASVNFAGIYRCQKSSLILGPFQGKVACVHIAFGQGVCGKAAQTQSVQLIPDVHQFAGHIACDQASNSELVIPIYKNQTFWGVFDFDSPQLSRFDQTDVTYLTKIAGLVFGD